MNQIRLVKKLVSDPKYSKAPRSANAETNVIGTLNRLCSFAFPHTWSATSPSRSMTVNNTIPHTKLDWIKHATSAPTKVPNSRMFISNLLVQSTVTDSSSIRCLPSMNSMVEAKAANDSHSDVCGVYPPLRIMNTANPFCTALSSAFRQSIPCCTHVAV